MIVLVCCCEACACYGFFLSHPTPPKKKKKRKRKEAATTVQTTLGIYYVAGKDQRTYSVRTKWFNTMQINRYLKEHAVVGRSEKVSLPSRLYLERICHI